MRLQTTGWASRNRQDTRICPKCRSSDLRLDTSGMYWLCACGEIISKKAMQTERRAFL